MPKVMLKNSCEESNEVVALEVRDCQTCRGPKECKEGVVQDTIL